MAELRVIDAKKCKITWNAVNRLYLSFDPTKLYESETRIQFTALNGRHKDCEVIILKKRDNDEEENFIPIGGQ